VTAPAIDITSPAQNADGQILPGHGEWVTIFWFKLTSFFFKITATQCAAVWQSTCCMLKLDYRGSDYQGLI